MIYGSRAIQLKYKVWRKRNMEKKQWLKSRKRRLKLNAFLSHNSFTSCIWRWDNLPDSMLVLSGVTPKRSCVQHRSFTNVLLTAPILENCLQCGKCVIASVYQNVNWLPFELILGFWDCATADTISSESSILLLDKSKFLLSFSLP